MKTMIINNIKPITIFLGEKAHTQAQYSAIQQTSNQKGKKAYLNTLALYAVHDYLRWLQIDSNLHESDSWQPGIQSLNNTADLLIPQIGRLECCPILPTENYLTISPQATEERIGYVAVKFEDNLDRVQILGFLPAVAPARESQQISLSKLQSLELLLEKISQPLTQEETEPKITINLSRWWSEIFEPGWLSLEALFSDNVLVDNLALREPAEKQREETDKPNLPIRVRRGKTIHLGKDAVGLVVTCTPAAETEIDILVQIYPTGEQIYLPNTLELKILDKNQILIPELMVQARDVDNCIQLSFTGDLEETFIVTLTLDKFSFTETFQI